MVLNKRIIEREYTLYVGNYYAFRNWVKDSFGEAVRLPLLETYDEFTSQLHSLTSNEEVELKKVLSTWTVKCSERIKFIGDIEDDLSIAVGTHLRKLSKYAYVMDVRILTLGDDSYLMNSKGEKFQLDLKLHKVDISNKVDANTDFHREEIRQKVIHAVESVIHESIGIDSHIKSLAKYKDSVKVVFGEVIVNNINDERAEAVFRMAVQVVE